MKKCKFNVLLLTTIICGGALLCYTPAQAQPQGGGKKGGQSEKKGPPPEAFTACEGKSSGTSCTVDTPHGPLSGTCETPHGDKLVCAPEGNKERGKSQNDRKGPPSESESE